MAADVQDRAASPDHPHLTALLGTVANSVCDAASVVLSPADNEAAQLRYTEQAVAELKSASICPWQTLGEQFSILEEELKSRILRISESADNFSPEQARMNRRPGEILPGCLPMAIAALDADHKLQSLRFRVVPAHLSEEEFWRCYFWHVANIKIELCNDWVTANKARREALLADEQTLGDVDALGEATADFDLDEEFDRLVCSPTLPQTS